MCIYHRWSYDIGLVHYIGISTEHDYFIGSTQFKWIEHDLRNVDRTITPWIILIGHRPMYVNSVRRGVPGADEDVMEQLIENLETLLWDNRVNLALWGHAHTMQRQSAVFKKNVVQKSSNMEWTDSHTNEIYQVAYHDKPQATIHIIVGTGGGTLSNDESVIPPDWNEKCITKFGYGAITVVNSTHILWEFVTTENNLVADRMVIEQSQNQDIHWSLPRYSPLFLVSLLMMVFVLSLTIWIIFMIYKFVRTQSLYVNLSGSRIRSTSYHEYEAL